MDQKATSDRMVPFNCPAELTDEDRAWLTVHFALAGEPAVLPPGWLYVEEPGIGDR